LPNALDIIFVVDNSYTMMPKQKKLAAQLPKFIASLKDPVSGQYPAMRMGFLSTDVGTGLSATCMPQYGDRGSFQLQDSTASRCGVSAYAHWLEVDAAGNGNFTGELGQVFQCLALAIGQSGCGFEQPLNALLYAFTVVQPNTGYPSVKPFLRPGARLALVMVTDEDDCSMPLNSLLAQANLSATESWSLRCATRGHACGGAKLPYPTDQSLQADYATCAPRTDFCPENESGEKPTTCSPLADYRKIAQVIKDAKGPAADIIVASSACPAKANLPPPIGSIKYRTPRRTGPKSTTIGRSATIRTTSLPPASTIRSPRKWAPPVACGYRLS
jgi:hypothetical protein